ncbi:MAG TPA: TM2 domain-containing protein [Pseudobdellovibrionaceae bacterium]|nr:TM2 domain-containing protein [Pseudobdellovibrionaceae bacterium]
MKSRISAALLALFFGGLGVHKFYLGRVAAGFIYLIFCWTFIPSIISFFEALILLFQSDEDFDAKFNLGKRASSSDAAEELTKLASLFEKNILTKEEFEEKKKILLQRI